jgi:hypothetical protein
MEAHSIRLGFDLRTSLNAPDPEWTQARRAQYLLRRGVARPLSVDPCVWKRVEGAHLKDYRPLLPFHQAAQLKTQLDQLQEDATIIEVTVVASHHAEYWQNITHGIGGETKELLYSSLGYDVADRYFTSALSNCALPPPLLTTTRNQFASSLNNHGLFSNLNDALRFRSACQLLVPEHNPFEVYRLAGVSLASPIGQH